MEFLNNELSEEYKRLTDQLSEESAQFKSCVISIVDVLGAYFSIIDYFLENSECEEGVGSFGPRDKKSLSTIVDSQISGYSGNLESNRDLEKCATLFYGLIKNHPFHSCNKRTALLTALHYLAKLNREPTATQKELEIITLIIASNTIRDRSAFKPYTKFEDGEVRFLARYLQENTQPIDMRSYLITYNALNKILGGFGFNLNHPHGNSIDIFRIETKSSLFGLPKKRKKYTKVGVLNFPGWTRSVSKKEMNHIRELTGLTAKEGFDSQLVYKGVPPLSSLINHYSGVLQQLAKKDS